MRNVAPTRALARRSRQLLTISFVVAAIGVFFAVMGFALFVIQLAAPNTPAYSAFAFVRGLIIVIGVLIFLVGVGLAVRAVTWKTDNDLAQVAGKFLAQYLDERYHFIRNVSQREIGYIDAVLVGPPGALVFRILDIRGVYANEGAEWLKQDQNKRWQPAAISPSREAVDDVKALRAYLGERKLQDVPVYGVVVFLREAPTIQIMTKNPLVPASTLQSLLQTLSTNYLAKERIEQAKINAVVRLLYTE